MRKLKQITIAIMMGALCLSFVACGKKEEATTEATTQEVTTEATTEEVTTEVSHEGETYNELTGEWAKDYVSKRPVAVMINNIKEALPSSSTKQADVIYECMVEGGITRLLAVFSDYDQLEKIGSVRSSRHYYINIANEYDAIYVCYGQSKPAKSMLDSGAINVVNGYTYGPAFYRDTARVAPHNAYTTGERLVAAIEDFGYASTYSDEHKSVFSFNEEETELENAETANVIHINYSNYSKPYLNYDKENKVYERYEYDAPQIDNQAPEGENVLTFKNVIVMISHYECINAENDLQDLKQTGQGQGYYCTDGKAIPITWKKESDKAITKYYTENGEELKLNPGKTWISIIGDSANAGVSFE